MIFAFHTILPFLLLFIRIEFEPNAIGCSNDGFDKCVARVVLCNICGIDRYDGLSHPHLNGQKPEYSQNKCPIF